jgi:transcription elongation factor GreB
MSKAFTRENDNADDDDSEISAPAIPAGAKNYITPSGLKRLQDELKELVFKTRPEVTQIVSWAAGNGDRSENGDYIYGKKRLREIDKRIRFLNKRLESVEVVVKSDQVLFGATVTILDEDDNEKTYSIVGVDETDPSRGLISWVSPLANALFKAREGDYVTFKSPKGVQHIEVLRVVYKELES